MNKVKQFAVVAIMGLTFASCVNVLNHNQDTAAIKAVEFAQAAIIERDFDKASKYLPASAQKAESAKQIEDIVSRMHPGGYPTEVVATEYEPVPGQQAIRIFLVGKSDENEEFYYSFVMYGTVDESYGPVEMLRDTKPFKSSSDLRKPLPVKRSTAG